jgi:hypothetical protein
MRDIPRMTPRTRTRWRNCTSTGAICLLLAAFIGTLWYGATYHAFPGMVSSVVHWCGRDYQTGGGRESWAQVTAAERPRQVRVVGSYPPIFGFSRPLLAPAVPGARSPGPGEPCAMAVYVRTGPGRYQPYTLEGGP